jgi:hypothetical protein
VSRASHASPLSHSSVLLGLRSDQARVYPPKIPYSPNSNLRSMASARLGLPGPALWLLACLRSPPSHPRQFTEN